MKITINATEVPQIERYKYLGVMVGTATGQKGHPYNGRAVTEVGMILGDQLRWIRASAVVKKDVEGLPKILFYNLSIN